MDSPLVSLCLPTYNGELFLQDALNSIVKQTYTNIEVIVSDDNSNDNTLLLVTKFKEKVIFPVHILHHSPNGIGANWNNCIKNARGVYIKFLFQDDILFPSCIEEMVRFLNTNQEIGLVCAKRNIIIEGEKTKKVKEWLENYGDLQTELKLNDVDKYVLDRTFFKDSLVTLTAQNFIGEPSGTLFRKSMVSKIGYFREDMIQILDLEFYYRILKNSKIAILNKRLYSFRIHENQATNLNSGKDEGDLLLYKKILLKQYFWYLRSNLRQQLLDLLYPLGGRIFRKLRKFSS